MSGTSLPVLFSPYFEDRVTIIRDPEQFEGGEFSLFDLEGKAVRGRARYAFRLLSVLHLGRQAAPRDRALSSARMTAWLLSWARISPPSWGRSARSRARSAIVVEDYDFNQTALPGLAIDSWEVGAAVREECARPALGRR